MLACQERLNRRAAHPCISSVLQYPRFVLQYLAKAESLPFYSALEEKDNIYIVILQGNF